MSRWSAPAKIVHFTTCLRGQVFAFYKSCSSDQKADYNLLVAEFRKRFTPVRIQAVRTSRFHKQKQQPGETVDCFAQELRKLFYKAYPATA